MCMDLITYWRSDPSDALPCFKGSIRTPQEKNKFDEQSCLDCWFQTLCVVSAAKDVAIVKDYSSDFQTACSSSCTVTRRKGWRKATRKDPCRFRTFTVAKVVSEYLMSDQFLICEWGKTPAAAQYCCNRRCCFPSQGSSWTKSVTLWHWSSKTECSCSPSTRGRGWFSGKPRLVCTWEKVRTKQILPIIFY
jgi:hypothetical protein